MDGYIFYKSQIAGHVPAFLLYKLLNMKTYIVPVTWMYQSTIEVKAETANEAGMKVLTSNAPLPTGEYCKGSFEVDFTNIEDLSTVNPDVMSKVQTEYEAMRTIKPDWLLYLTKKYSLTESQILHNLKF